MPHLPIVPRAAIALFALLGAAAAVKADAIDGDWCLAAQTLSIQGPQIRTPGGTQMAGDYTRHTFSYTVPANEPGAGQAVAMRILSEETMMSTRGAAAPETWRRCKPVS